VIAGDLAASRDGPCVAAHRRGDGVSSPLEFPHQLCRPRLRRRPAWRSTKCRRGGG